MKGRFKSERGFTLIELMATLGILAMIIAIAVPAVGNILAKAETDADVLSKTMMETAGAMADANGQAHDEGALYRIPSLIEQGYLKLDKESPYNKPENYVVKTNTGVYVYNGEISEPETPVIPEVPVDPNDYCPEIGETGMFNITTVNGNVSINGFAAGYAPKPTNLVIPNTHCGEIITHIASQAFDNEKLTSVVLPEMVEDIGNYAFQQNALTVIDLPDTITYIGNSSFSGNKLATVIIPDGITSVTTNSFSDNPTLTSVDLPDGLTTISTAAFSNSGLLSLTIPDSVKSIDRMAFFGNRLAVVHLPAELEMIEEAAFSGNRLTEIRLPSSLISIGKNAFSNNSLVTVEIPESVVMIESQAFMSNLLTDVYIPNPYTEVAAADAFMFNQMDDARVNIHAYDGSFAQQFALDNGFSYVSMD